MKVSIIVISKNEESLSGTLAALQQHIRNDDVNNDYEVDLTVVDASAGKLDSISKIYPEINWIDYTPPSGVRVSIPHQRNHGIQATRGEIIVFTDAGCLPREGWLSRLISPLSSGHERMTCGPSWVENNVFSPERGAQVPSYVDEAPTINLAFTRELADKIGKFDETFEYGSDIDFTRRAVASGARIRYIPDAVVEHDWGSFRRQLKRSRQYGAARIRLTVKHPKGALHRFRNEPVPIAYAIFILGLPIVFRFRSYLLLAAIPLWRARKRPYPVRVVICHFAEGIGALQEITQMIMRTRLEILNNDKNATVTRD